jgi:Uma2 family endonuclease
MSTAHQPGAPHAVPPSRGTFFDEYDPTYPDSDGMPMADNTTQERWIATIKGGLHSLFRDDANVFVAADLLWYPVQFEPTIRCAPDALVAFGRPKGYRHSYKSWVEDGVAPHVVFEILSPGNTRREMTRQLLFYNRHGVEEYYLYDPMTGLFRGWIRDRGRLRRLPHPDGWTSPRLGITFEAPPVKDALVIRAPDGRAFETYVSLFTDREAQRRRATRAVRERIQAERDKAQAERDKAQAVERAERLAARLREAGLEDD